MDALEEMVESIGMNFLNGNLSDCKRQLEELGSKPMTLVYVTLELIQRLDDDDFIRWISKNIEE